MRVLHHKHQQQKNQQRNEFEVQHTDKIESIYLRSNFLLISVWDLLVLNLNVTFPVSWLITGFVTRLTRRLPLVEQELLTLPEQLSSPPVFSGVRVTRSLVLNACFVDRCLSFCPFSFGHCVVCSSSIYGF
jgi:hypothetical protein